MEPSEIAILEVLRDRFTACGSVPGEVNINRDEFDCLVSRELADDVERPRLHAAGEQHPVVTTPRDQLREVVEPFSESVNDTQQLNRLEIPGRRFTVWSAFRAQLTIKVLKEAVGNPD